MNGNLKIQRRKEENENDPIGGILGGGAVQYLLSEQGQFTIDGAVEPLSEIVAPVVEVDTAQVDSRQMSLGPYPEPKPLFHAPDVDGKPPCDCWTGIIKGGVRADGTSKPRFHYVPCSRRACASSEGVNGWKRASDCWDGTARSGKKKIGLRSVAGVGVDLCRMTITIPPRFRHLLGTTKGIQELRSLVAKGLMKWLSECLGVKNALFYVREYFHPCGEDPSVYHPHFNFLIPAVYFDRAQGRGRGFIPWRKPEELKRFREIVAACFAKFFRVSVGVGDVPWETTGENANWQYAYLRGGLDEENKSKRHMVKYNSRLKGFSSWNHLIIRPQSFGLAHAKNRDLLETVIQTLGIKQMSEWNFDLGHYVTATGRSEKEVREDLDIKADQHRSECSECLLAFRAQVAGSGGLLSRTLSNHTQGWIRATADPPVEQPFRA